MEKLEHSHIVGGNVKWYSSSGKQFVFLRKLNTGLTYDPVILLLGIYPKELKPSTQIDTCTSVFSAVLFKVAKRWK